MSEAAPAAKVRIGELLLLIILTLASLFLFQLRELLMLPRTIPYLDIAIFMLESCFVLAWSLRDRSPALWRKFPAPIRIMFGLWLLGATLATLAADHLVPALVRQSLLLMHALFALSLGTYLQRQPDRSRQLITALIVSALLYLLIFAVYYALIPDPFRFNWGGGLPGFLNIRFTAQLLAAVLVLALLPWFGRWRISPMHLLTLVAAVGGWAFLWWSGSRGAVFAILGAGLFMLPLLGRRMLAPIALLIITALSGFIIATQFPTASGGMGLQHFFPSLIEQGSEKLDLLSNRTLLWQTAMAAILAHPWLGLGPDGFSFISPVFSVYHPHNALLQLAADWGMPTALIFCALVLSLMVALYRRARHAADAHLATVTLWALTAMLMHSMVTGNLYHTRASLLFAMLAGIALAIVRPQLRQPAISSRIEGAATLLLPCLCMALISLHAAVIHYVESAAFRPSPTDRAVTLVRWFPSQIDGARFDAGLDQWIIGWRSMPAAETLAWLRWGRRHSRFPAFYSLREADLLSQMGKMKHAERRYADLFAHVLGQAWQAMPAADRAAALSGLHARHPTWANALLQGQREAIAGSPKAALARYTDALRLAPASPRLRHAIETIIKGTRSRIDMQTMVEMRRKAAGR